MKTTTTTELTALRTAYRAQQIASGLTPSTFRSKVDSLLHELADGEDPITCPYAMVEAAREVSYYASKKGGF
jgi:hypothetical protein